LWKKGHAFFLIALMYFLVLRHLSHNIDCYKSITVDGWMDGWMADWMDGWMTSSSSSSSSSILLLLLLLKPRSGSGSGSGQKVTKGVI
jgi:hypothetical protein